MKPDLRKRALQAHRLLLKHVTGFELAARLKIGNEGGDADIRARDLADIGSNIAAAEACDLTQLEWDAMKAIARVSARRVERGDDLRILARDVDHVVGKPTGWCWRIVIKRLSVDSVDSAPFNRDRLGFLEIIPSERRLWLTASGWAYVWAAKLVKSNWRVP